MKAQSFKVRLRKTDVYEGKRKTTYYVRWTVERIPFKQPFDSQDAAKSYEAALRTAANDGLPFSTTTGEPVAWDRELPDQPEPEPPAPVGLLDHLRDYTRSRWSRWSAHQRENVADTLMNAMIALLPHQDRPDGEALRKALRRHAFNRNAAEPTGNVRTALTWALEHQPPVTCLEDLEAMNAVIEQFATRIDGGKRVTGSQQRMRAAFNTPIDRAIAAGHITTNVLQTHPDFKTAPFTNTPGTVDKRVCANIEQGRRLLEAVETIQWSGPRLKAFYAVIFYAGLRPEEAADLRRTNITLPVNGRGCGEMYLEGATTYTSPAWTDDGTNREHRGLKHRAPDTVRTVPISPALAAILRGHLTAFEPGPDGRVFASHYGQIISPRTCQKVFRKARTAAFTEQEAASPLASRIYDLRHACLTRWLNAGVPAPDVATWAGNSVEVLHRHYYNCVAGQLADNQQKITAAEQHAPTSKAIKAEEA